MRSVKCPVITRIDLSADSRVCAVFYEEDGKSTGGRGIPFGLALPDGSSVLVELQSNELSIVRHRVRRVAQHQGTSDQMPVCRGEEDHDSSTLKKSSRGLSRECFDPTKIESSWWGPSLTRSSCGTIGSCGSEAARPRKEAFLCVYCASVLCVSVNGHSVRRVCDCCLLECFDGASDVNLAHRQLERPLSLSAVVLS